MKKILLLSFLAGVMVLTSCKKFLDQQPYSTASDQTTWKSDGDANASVAACYSLIRSAFNSAITYYAYGDLPADEVTSIYSNDYNFNDVMNMNWGVHVAAASTSDLRMKLRLYTNFYTGIAQSNRCLYYINTMPLSAFNGDDADAQQTRKNQLLGEAYFTRAFNYFYISRVWGDVPLVTDYIADASTAQPLPRTAQQTVLNQCVADLNIAKQDLDWQDQSSTDRVVRADKGAVFALLAHIYAWEGKYDSCSMACDSVITKGGYQLVDGSSLATIYKGQSTEGIFEIAQNLQSESIAVYYSISGVTLASPLLANQTQPGWTLNTGLIASLFTDSNDLRYKTLFDSVNTGSATVIECAKYSNVQNINNSTAYQVAENNIIVFRLADIELLKAEALAAKSTPDYGGALTWVNAIRARAGAAPVVGATGPALLDTIIAERGRELFMEGHRFYDLVRLGRLTGELLIPNVTSSGDFTGGKYYWPVDPTLFLTNPYLKQTSFWAGRVQ